jgi:hypothetical protein
VLTRVVDRNGFSWADLEWDGDQLRSLAVPDVIVRGARIPDSLFGEAHAIETPLGERLTTISTIEWARPTEIPAIADPAKLPAGSGGAIMNVLALLAEQAEITALRYAGPYPTTALWKTLARSFQAYGSEQEFTKDLIHRMATIARDPIAIDFLPAPHERLAIPGGHVELREGIERATLDGVTYERGGSPARITEDHSATGVAGPRAELWFGDARYAVVAKFRPDGSLREAFPLPVCEADVIGKGFPEALVGALAMLIQELVPAPLGAQVPAWLSARTIAWADLGARAARVRGDVVEVHAALWSHVAPHGLGRLALALAEALAPVISAALVAEAARATVQA